MLEVDIEENKYHVEEHNIIVYIVSKVGDNKVIVLQKNITSL